MKPNSESIEGEVDWGKTKFNYYFTDYVDKDYPSDLTRKEERLAAIEQEEALRLQRKLYSTIDNINFQPILGAHNDDTDPQDYLIDFIEQQNKALHESKGHEDGERSKKRKRVTFAGDEMGSDECEFNSDDDADGNKDDEEKDDNDDEDDNDAVDEDGRKRRPTNVSIKKNRGLTPYKKKELRNPRVKHKLKFKKAMTKRRRLVKEAKTEFHRYSGESTGIKTSTVRSVKL